MRDFSMSETDAMNCPTDRAFALAAFHAETHPALPLERAGDGYLAQEVQRHQIPRAQTAQPRD